MLVRFNIKNFLSFNERIDPDSKESFSVEFSMLPGRARLNSEQIIKNDAIDLLRFGALYGANASGKSNLTKAISFFQKFVENGKCPIGASEMYCKINKDNKNKPSYFEVEILVNNEVYSYGFEVILSKNIITSEWLIKISKNKEDILFYKDGEEDSYHFDNILKDNQALEIYQQGLAGSNVLLLSEMNKDKLGFYKQNQSALILRDIYSWITENLEIVFPGKPTKESEFMINTTSLDKVAELLHSFGTGIVKITEIEEDVDKVLSILPSFIKKQFTENVEIIQNEINRDSEVNYHKKLSLLIRNPKDIIALEFDGESGLKAYSIQFEHESISSDIHFRVSEESDGTIRLFELIEILLSQKEKTYVIDELDRCLHPCLTYKFIEKFFEFTKDRKVQLIVTTHEPSLMDLQLLRRDEIWFVDKDITGNSSIYSLEEYNTRFDQKVDKAYLDGRYGGVPSFDTLFPIGD